MSVLQIEYVLRTSGYSESAIAVVLKVLEIKAKHNTAVSIKNNKAKTTTAVGISLDDYNRVKDMAYTLFGGFGSGQIRWLLRFTDAETIVRLMLNLRRQSWARGWVRTRDAVEKLRAA